MRDRLLQGARLLCSGALCVVVATSAQATDYVVNTAEDTADTSDSLVSLREAIAAAGTNAAVGDAAAGQSDAVDTITFDSSVTSITVAGAAYDIPEGLTITGPVTLTRSGTTGRIFDIDSSGASSSALAQVTMSLLTLTGGNVTDNGGAISIASAGATETVVSLTSMTMTGNTASGTGAGAGGGAIYTSGGTVNIDASLFGANEAEGALGNGGAILNGGTMVITNSTFGNATTLEPNEANRAGGAVEHFAGTLSVTDSSFFGNRVNNDPETGGGNGGAIHSTAGTVTVNGGSYRENFAGGEGGALWNNSNATMNILRSTDGPAEFRANEVAGGEDINGAGDATRGGGALFNLGTMAVTDAVIRDNEATGRLGNGGGVMGRGSDASTTITNSSIASNSANRAGGGIENQSGATLLVVGGSITDNEVGSAPGNGGGVHDGCVGGACTGEVTLRGVTISDNTAALEGGGVWTAGNTIISASAVGANDMIITRNTASGDAMDNGGGGVFNEGGTMNIILATISSNTADGDAGSGGGIFNNAGGLTVRNTNLSSNVANRAGGGIEDRNPSANTLIIGGQLENNNVGVAPATAAPGNGGGFHLSGTGTVIVSNVSITGNMAAREGGGLWNSGSGATMTVINSTLDSNMAMGNRLHDGGGGLFNNGGELTLSNVQVTDNVANGSSGSGGGLLNLTGDVTITGSTFDGNSASRAGGAIEDNSNGANESDDQVPAGITALTLRNSTLSDNMTGPSPGNGGGVHITGAGVVTVDDSAVVNNQAVSEGGGLWNFSTATMNVINTTVSGNEAPLGGGVFNQAGDDLTLTNVTVADNRATTEGGGIRLTDEGSATAVNLLVGDNTAPTGNDVSGELTATNSLVENPVGSTITGSNNITGQDPQLQPLALNGGTTLNHAVTNGPAIDVGDAATCAGAAVGGRDQRNRLRDPAVSRCDIGAFESVTEESVTLTNFSEREQNISFGGNAVPALVTQFVNDTAGERIEVFGFRGNLVGNRSAQDEIDTIQVFIDRDGNRQFDAGSTDIALATSQASGNNTPGVIFNSDSGSFSVAFDGERGFEPNAQDVIVLSANLKPISASGFSSGWIVLILLPLLGGAVLLPNRLRKAAVATVLISGTVACGGGGSSSPSAPDDGFDYQFIITSIDARTAAGDNPLGGSPLPIAGSELTLR